MPESVATLLRERGLTVDPFPSTLPHSKMTAHAVVIGGPLQEACSRRVALHELGRTLVTIWLHPTEASSSDLDAALEAGFDDVLSTASSDAVMAARLHNAARLGAASLDSGPDVAAVDAFVGAAAHDMKSPLVSIRRFSQIALEDLADGRPEEVSPILQRIEINAARMIRLIDAIVRFVQLERIELYPTEVVPELLFGDVRVALRSAFRGSSATLEYHPGPQIFGDYELLLEAVRHLVDNALKYGGIRAPRIEIRTERQGQWDTLTVLDTGNGIPLQHHARVLECFGRLHRRDQIEGSGLGLNIVQRIARRHGGRLLLSSSEGAGSAFTLQLPVAPSDASQHAGAPTLDAAASGE